MATVIVDLPSPVPVTHKAGVVGAQADQVLISSLSGYTMLRPGIQAPFTAIRQLFDCLNVDADLVVQLNQAYPARGLYKDAATVNRAADQKLTIDLSSNRISNIPLKTQMALRTFGLSEVVNFFDNVTSLYVDPILKLLSATIGVDLEAIHRDNNVNFRLCDYTPQTADPSSENGCGEHRDYGTFSVIFQDDVWHPVPGDATIVLCGWCAYVVSGGHLVAVKHRVRRKIGVRRLSAVLFVAPDLDVTLKPLRPDQSVAKFSETVLTGGVKVAWFKEVMGKKWRQREGNERLQSTSASSQDQDIEDLIHGS